MELPELSPVLGEQYYNHYLIYAAEIQNSYCPRKMVACRGEKGGGRGNHQHWHICEEEKVVITYPMITMLLPITVVINMDPVAKLVLLFTVFTNTDFEL